MSPKHAPGLPPIIVTPSPPPPPGPVIPGPCGAPSQAGGGALGIGHVCWSPIRQAGCPPIRTVTHAAPSNGEPCAVESPSRAAGLPIDQLSRHPSLAQSLSAGICGPVECRARHEGPLSKSATLRRIRKSFRSLNLLPVRSGRPDTPRRAERRRQSPFV